MGEEFERELLTSMEMGVVDAQTRPDSAERGRSRGPVSATQPRTTIPLRRGIVLTGWLVACSPAVLPAASTPSPSAALSPLPAPNATSTPPVAKAPAATCHHEVPAQCASAPPSFADEVKPLLEKRCFRCHTGDGPAADEHDFSKAELVFSQRKDILEEVASCAMPPKAPLSDAEANTLLNWAACAATGAPRRP